MNNPGASPPEGALLSPIATAMYTPESGEPTYLYVLNSNFDLHYNGGSFQSYDLAELNDAIDTKCVAPRDGLSDDECIDDPNCAMPESCILVPEELEDEVDDAGGELLVNTVPGLLTGEVRVGSYGSAVTLSDDGTVAYLAIRADASITRVEVDASPMTGQPNGRLRCGGAFGEVHRCVDASTVVDEGLTLPRDVSLPPDPLTVSSRSLSAYIPGEEGTAIFVGHRGGATSYIVDRGDGLVLVDSFPGPVANLVAATIDDDGKVWLTSSGSRFITRIGVRLDGTEGEIAEDALLYDAGLVRLDGLGSVDARAVRFDDAGRVLVLTRTPGSLVIAEPPADANGILPALASIEVGTGPSRLQLATLAGHSLAFVSCYDSRDMYVIDLDRRTLVAVIAGMSGPFEFEVDTSRERIYVADFRTSVLRIVDLSPLSACLSGTSASGAECSPELLGLVGRPVSIQGAVR